MNGAIYRKWNLMKKTLEMGKSGIRPTWIYKFEQNVMSKELEEKDLRVMI